MSFAPVYPPRSAPLRVLHLEDSQPDAELVAAKLATEYPDCTIQHASSRQQFENALQKGAFDLILSDYTLQGYDGLSALQLAREQCPQKPFIFLSGTIGEERAIEALKCGATDYVIKDRPSRLVPAIRKALAQNEEEQRFRQTEEALQQNRERFRQITENVADLILMVDLSGHCVYSNPAYVATVGRPCASTEDDLFHDVHPEDQIAVRDLFRETVRTGIAARAEYRLMRSDGSVRHVEAQNSVVRNSAGVVTRSSSWPAMSPSAAPPMSKSGIRPICSTAPRTRSSCATWKIASRIGIKAP